MQCLETESYTLNTRRSDIELTDGFQASSATQVHTIWGFHQVSVDQLLWACFRMGWPRWQKRSPLCAEAPVHWGLASGGLATARQPLSLLVPMRMAIHCHEGHDDEDCDD